MFKNLFKVHEIDLDAGEHVAADFTGIAKETSGGCEVIVYYVFGHNLDRGNHLVNTKSLKRLWIASLVIGSRGTHMEQAVIAAVLANGK
jgi:hypothetical protein